MTRVLQSHARPPSWRGGLLVGASRRHVRPHVRERVSIDAVVNVTADASRFFRPSSRLKWDEIDSSSGARTPLTALHPRTVRSRSSFPSADAAKPPSVHAADAGTYTFECSRMCGAGHSFMRGTIRCVRQAISHESPRHRCTRPDDVVAARSVSIAQSVR